MPSNRPEHNPNRPWHARRKRDGIEFSLGCYTTEDEAIEKERRFDRDWPPDNATASRIRHGT